MSTIKDALSRKSNQNPQYDFLWRVELPQIDVASGDMLATGLGIPDTFNSFRSGRFGFTNTLNTATQLMNTAQRILPQDMHEINHRVYSFTAPFTTFDTTKVTKGPSFTYNAAQSDIGAVSMIIDEMEDGKTLDYLNNWMHLIEPDQWSRSVPAQYKRDIRYIKMSATKLDMHYSVYKGYFPTEISSSESSYDSNGILQYNVTFTGDSVDHIVIPEAQVVAMITAEEVDILKQQFSGGGFRIGAIDTSKAARVLDNVLDIFRR